MATSISFIPISFLFFAYFLVSLFSLFCSLETGYALDDEETLQSHHHTVQISSLLPPSVCSSSSHGRSSKRASLKVVHRYGPCSHLSLDKASAPTLTQFLSRDQSRVNSIHSRLTFNSVQNSLHKNYRATLPAYSGVPLGTGNYIVTVGLGTPKKDLSLIFDTGSDLTWTQCRPCRINCYEQQDPTFDPSASTTYKNISCESAACSQLTFAGARRNCSASTCIYGIQYFDGSYSVGYFGTETLTLTPTDVFPDFPFGCGQNNRGLFGAADGLLGLARSLLSIVSQTASKYGKYFSYCLPSSMPSSIGHLTFGKEGSSGALKFTPLIANSRGPSFYFIDIKGIKVGGRKLLISQSVFKTAGTIIDSGTVITRLPPPAYTSLRTAFRQQMRNYPLTKALSILDTCYDLSSYSTVLIPKISFIFGGNIEVPIALPGILFGGSASQMCLAFAGNGNATDAGILGNRQQQTLEVVYDVAGGKLGFGTGQC